MSTDLLSTDSSSIALDETGALTDEQRLIALEALARLERQLRAQQIALAAVPYSEPVTGGVLALLAAPAAEIRTADLPSYALPRLAALIDGLTLIHADLALRQGRVAARLSAVNQVIRPTMPGRAFDHRS